MLLCCGQNVCYWSCPIKYFYLELLIHVHLFGNFKAIRKRHKKSAIELVIYSSMILLLRRSICPEA